jgi:hypothetical protein
MVKKYTGIVMLGLMAVLALSAFSPVNYQPGISNAYSIADVSLRALPVLKSAPISSDGNFRNAHVWNGLKIPSMDVTGLLDGLQSAPVSSDTNFRNAHTWNGLQIPSMNVTSLLTAPPVVPHYYEYGPVNRATGLLTVKKVNSGH